MINKPYIDGTPFDIEKVILTTVYVSNDLTYGY